MAKLWYRNWGEREEIDTKGGSQRESCLTPSICEKKSLVLEEVSTTSSRDLKKAPGVRISEKNEMVA